MFTENYLFMRDLLKQKKNALLRNLSINFSEKNGLFAQYALYKLTINELLKNVLCII